MIGRGSYGWMMVLRIDVWSDIACPWCFVGKRRLEAALADFPHKDQVALVWRAFELNTAAPRSLPAAVDYPERIAKKYGTTRAQGQAMCDRMANTAAEDGLRFRFDSIRPSNTFDAHRLLHLALEEGCQDALKERLFAAYLEQGEAIGEHDVLLRLACEVGLDEDAVRAVLDGDAHGQQVREDQAMAKELGVTGVPFFVLDMRLAISGAQPAAVLRHALDDAWSHQHASAEGAAATAVAGAAPEEDAACGPDGCAPTLDLAPVRLDENVLPQ